DEALALRPRLPLGIGRGTVVEDAPVRRPCPRPLERRVRLLPVRLSPRGLVLAVAEHAAVDPAPAGRRAVRLQQLVGRERLTLVVPAVDLGEDGLGARLLVLARG